MSYAVPAGLYALGTPGPDAPVVVTANYKMTYDRVRHSLAGRDAWLLVLETHGINVWCAAGKGTFGTEELVRRLDATGLPSVVTHRRLLLPILGGPGVAAHEVRKRTGFEVRYAALRAEDLPEYLDNGMVTTPPMRELTFTLGDRLALVPVELAQAVKPAILLAAVASGLAAALAGWAPLAGLKAGAALLGAVLAGTVIAPALLPWLPGPSFALKGAVVGTAWAALCAWTAGAGAGAPSLAALFLVLSAVSGFFTLNFTGSTPFTSRSGVKREMRLAMPALAAAFSTGIVVWLAGSLL
ncbi:MAG: acetyl-CoA synthase subunit gamma [Deltaproteobacteria bacterium]|nr:acetyl-CoA synthase subunit gamma [Deltaproteobacteria bacterium]